MGKDKLTKAQQKAAKANKWNRLAGRGTDRELDTLEVPKGDPRRSGGALKKALKRKRR